MAPHENSFSNIGSTETQNRNYQCRKDDAKCNEKNQSRNNFQMNYVEDRGMEK